MAGWTRRCSVLGRQIKRDGEEERLVSGFWGDPLRFRSTGELRVHPSARKAEGKLVARGKNKKPSECGLG